MTVYTFAFLHRPPTPLTLPPGIHTSVEIVPAGDLAAVVERGITPEALKNDDNQLMQAVLAHDRVIRAIFDQAVILPLRFGTCFINGDRLVEHLQSQSDAYLKSLEALSGKAEYMLKVIPVELETTSVPSQKRGKEYLLEKKRRYQTQADYQQQQQREFENLLQDIDQFYRCSYREKQDSEIRKINILCDRQVEDTLLKNCQLWRDRYRSWDLHLSEALPPYHFIA